MAAYDAPKIAALYNYANGSMGANAVGEHTRIMAAIAMAESSGDPNAMNPNSTATGLWQIMYSLWVKDPDASKLFKTRDDLKDPTVNAKVARIVYNKSGYGAWKVYTSGKYREFLDDTPVDTTNLGDVVTGAVGGIGGAVISSPVDRYIKPITTWATQGFKVVGVAWAGMALLTIGLIILAMQTKAGKAVAGTAVKAATKGVVK